MIKTCLQYEKEIKNLHSQLLKNPDSVGIQSKLDNQLKGWVSRIAVSVEVANNEKRPWTANEIGFETEHMQTKEESGHRQVGDYVAKFKGGSLDAYCNTVVERKGGKKGLGGADDFYGTYMNDKNRDRFYREYQRFKRDKRFKNGQLIVVAECSFLDFMNFTPLFLGKERNVYHISASPESRIGTVAGLFERKIPVMFACTRVRATQFYNRTVRQNLIKNYDFYLDLDPIEVYADA